jgi:hypothetical protein
MKDLVLGLFHTMCDRQLPEDKAEFMRNASRIFSLEYGKENPEDQVVEERRVCVEAYIEAAKANEPWAKKAFVLMMFAQDALGYHHGLLKVLNALVTDMKEDLAAEKN